MLKSINVREAVASTMELQLQRIKSWAEENPFGVLMLKGFVLWGSFLVFIFVQY